MTSTDGLLAATIREESGRLVTAPYRRFGDFDVAEEAVQGAVVEALTQWRRDGTPHRPAAWLMTAAHRNVLDLLRARGRRARVAGYYLWHAARAELLRLSGRDDEAAAADRRALELTSNNAERRLIQTRLHRHPLTDGS